MNQCTENSPCPACAAGLALLEGRRPDRPKNGAGSPESPRMRRRFGPRDDVLCRAALLPRNSCAGCQAGYHSGEAWA